MYKNWKCWERERYCVPLVKNAPKRIICSMTVKPINDSLTPYFLSWFGFFYRKKKCDFDRFTDNNCNWMKVIYFFRWFFIFIFILFSTSIYEQYQAHRNDRIKHVSCDWNEKFLNEDLRIFRSRHFLMKITRQNEKNGRCERASLRTPFISMECRNVCVCLCVRIHITCPQNTQCATKHSIRQSHPVTAQANKNKRTKKYNLNETSRKETGVKLQIITTVVTWPDKLGFVVFVGNVFMRDRFHAILHVTTKVAYEFIHRICI